MIEAR
jgi:hypothetical protein